MRILIVKTDDFLWLRPKRRVLTQTERLREVQKRTVKKKAVEKCDMYSLLLDLFTLRW